MAAPVTYTVGGTQYVALLAGYGGAGMLSIADTAAVKTYENKGRLIAFKLGGGEVPVPPKRAIPIGPPEPDSSLPPLKPEQVAEGARLYGRCAGCHSTGGGTPMLPNLARVKELGPDGLKAIVLGGALAPVGMPKFDDQLQPGDVDVLYEYIVRGLHNRKTGQGWY
jgi:quinohemoprotein ethanol dehydrogenase